MGKTSTWLTARILGTDDLVKVRTSQIALTKDAPAPSGADLVDALEKARIKAAQASQSSRKCSETTRRRRRRKSKKNSATDNAEAGSKQVQQKTPTKPHPQNSVPHGQPLSCFDPSYSPIIESHVSQFLYIHKYVFIKQVFCCFIPKFTWAKTGYVFQN